MKCDQCGRKIPRKKSEAPYYVHLSEPNINRSFNFCNRECLFRFFATDLVKAIIQLGTAVVRNEIISKVGGHEH